MSSNNVEVVREQSCQNLFMETFSSQFDFSILDNIEIDSVDEEQYLYNAPVELYNAARDVSLADFEPGDLLITSQRVVFVRKNEPTAFAFEDVSFQWVIEDIKACEIINDDMVVIETMEKSYIFLIHKKITPYVHKMITLSMSHSKVRDF